MGIETLGPSSFAGIDVALFATDASTARFYVPLAAKAGASLRLDERLSEWSTDDHRVSLRTDHGAYFADRAILAVGAWLPQMTNGVNLPLVIERQISHWFTPRDADSCSAAQCRPLATGSRRRETFRCGRLWTARSR